MFMGMMGCSNEGGIGVEIVSHRYGLSIASVSNYFRHVLFKLYERIYYIEPRLIGWPTAEDLAGMEVLVIGFPHCVFFVDEHKGRRWRQGNDLEQ